MLNLSFSILSIASNVNNGHLICLLASMTCTQSKGRLIVEPTKFLTQLSYQLSIGVSFLKLNMPVTFIEEQKFSSLLLISMLLRTSSVACSLLLMEQFSSKVIVVNFQKIECFLSSIWVNSFFILKDSLCHNTVHFQQISELDKKRKHPELALDCILHPRFQPFIPTHCQIKLRDFRRFLLDTLSSETSGNSLVLEESMAIVSLLSSADTCLMYIGYHGFRTSGNSLVLEESLTIVSRLSSADTCLMYIGYHGFRTISVLEQSEISKGVLTTSTSKLLQKADEHHIFHSLFDVHWISWLQNHQCLGTDRKLAKVY